MSYPDLQEATTYLHDHIPLSAAIAVTVQHLGVDKVTLFAPLAPNINHRQTAFGGSISSVAILSAWTYLHFRLRAEFPQNCRVVITSNETKYPLPVTDDFQASCLAPGKADWDRFIAAVRRHGKGRIVLAATIYVGNAPQTPLAQFTGTFVAITNLLEE